MPSKKSRWIALIITAILAGILLHLTPGCTIAPKEVRSTQASYSGNVQNSGMLSTPQRDELGFAVSQDYINAYAGLLGKYGSRLTPQRKSSDKDGLAKEGDHYRITDAVMERYLLMNQWRMDEQSRAP